MTDTPPPVSGAQAAFWVLEGPVAGGQAVRRLALHPLPFRIGRRRGLPLYLPYESISKEHAEIYWGDSGLRVRDLQSTNGTFANQVRIHDAPLREGDQLRFADYEFRLLRRAKRENEGEADQEPDTAVLDAHAPGRDQTGSHRLLELLELEKVEPVFQPIVVLPGGALTGFEALGRGRHPDLPESPLDLLGMAASMGLESELSRLFRRKAVDAFRGRSHVSRLFLNTHPKELEHPGLIESLTELRETAPRLELVLEIHESGITDPLWVAHLRKELGRLGMRLAFDDFGVGQSRIQELGEAPPHVVKFDRSLVNGIGHAPASRRRLVGSLVRAAAELLVQTVAEGVETREEADVCANLGFTHAQGYLFGHPAAADCLDLGH